jgi:hypothetical protein
MFKGFRKTVERIIVKYGKMSLEEFFQAEQKTIRIEKEHFLPFSVSKEGNMLYVGYYRVQNGDSIPDPIFIFQLDDDNEWCPIRLEQVLGNTDIGLFEHGRYYYYQGHFRDVRSFATTCANEWKCYYL